MPRHKSPTPWILSFHQRPLPGHLPDSPENETKRWAWKHLVSYKVWCPPGGASSGPVGSAGPAPSPLGHQTPGRFVGQGSRAHVCSWQLCQEPGSSRAVACSLGEGGNEADGSWAGWWPHPVWAVGTDVCVQRPPLRIRSHHGRTGSAQETGPESQPRCLPSRKPSCSWPHPLAPLGLDPPAPLAAVLPSTCPSHTGGGGSHLLICHPHQTGLARAQMASGFSPLDRSLLTPSPKLVCATYSRKTFTE